MKGKIIIVAIITIAAMQMFALWNGINGALLTTTIAVIAGLAGWVAPQPKFAGDKNARR